MQSHPLGDIAGDVTKKRKDAICFKGTKWKPFNSTLLGSREELHIVLLE